MPHSRPDAWIDSIAWGVLAVTFASGAVIAWDILVRGYRQNMAIMSAV